MKHVRLTARVDPERAPPLFDRLVNAAAVGGARVLDWNLSSEDAMLLFAVDGDPAPLVDGAAEFRGVDRVETAGDPAERPGAESRVVVHVRRSAVPIFSCLADALRAGGLIVRTPVVFRDGEVHARIVGDPGPLQAAFERRGSDIEVRIDEIRSRPGVDERPLAALTDRQREALAVATGLGYYETPREATHGDVAAELGCSAQTAGDHLRKAEAKLVDSALDALGPGR